MVTRQSPEEYFATAQLTYPAPYPPPPADFQIPIDRLGFWVLVILGTIGLVGILAIAVSRK